MIFDEKFRLLIKIAKNWQNMVEKLQTKLVKKVAKKR